MLQKHLKDLPYLEKHDSNEVFLLSLIPRVSSFNILRKVSFFLVSYIHEQEIELAYSI